jgi:hypothetical protein
MKKTLKVPHCVDDVRNDYQGPCASGALQLGLYSRGRRARLKNLDCKLMKEIKNYNSAGRMILTGTPLHVKVFINGFSEANTLLFQKYF